MERKRSIRRKPKPPLERAMDHCRAFTAFMFSNVGITFLVVLYIIAGKWNDFNSFRHLHLRVCMSMSDLGILTSSKNNNNKK